MPRHRSGDMVKGIGDVHGVSSIQVAARRGVLWLKTRLGAPATSDQVNLNTAMSDDPATRVVNAVAIYAS